MKRGVFVLTFLFLISSAFAITTDFGNIAVNYNYVHIPSVKYEPYPAEPGKYVDLWIKVQNAGHDDAKIVFKLTPRYPFYLDDSEQAERDVGSLLGGETTLVHYRVRVDSNAVEGSTPMFYEATVNGVTEKSSFEVWIQTIDANIAVNYVITQRIVPGVASPVTIELENLADSPMSNVNVNLDLSSATLPFIPVNSTTEKKVFVIKSKEKENFTFNLLALPGATSDAYKIPIEIKFTDGTGQNYTRESIIGLIVGANPDIMITVASSNAYSKGPGDISLKVTNRGVTDIKLASAYLEDTKDYQVLTENAVYLGKIDSDDYESADYKIKINKITNGVVPLKLDLEYLDANNIKYTETKNVDLKIVSAKDLGVNQGNSPASVIVVVILIGIGYFFYRRWEKKKLAKK